MKSPFARFLTLLFAAAQFALPAAVSIGDATVSRESRDQSSHVESGSSKQCRPPHSADCGVCRYLTTTTSRAGSAPCWSIVGERQATPISGRVASARIDVPDLPQSRAPPTA